MKLKFVQDVRIVASSALVVIAALASTPSFAEQNGLNKVAPTEQNGLNIVKPAEQNGLNIVKPAEQNGLNIVKPAEQNGLNTVKSPSVSGTFKSVSQKEVCLAASLLDPSC